MSLHNEYLLQDPHLQKALHHAPDGDIAPNEITRKSVLDYADKVVNLRCDSWLARIIKLCNAWQIPHWHASSFQAMGISSLVASFLVVALILHENPEDPIQVASAPSEVVQSEATPRTEPKLAQAQLGRDVLAKDNVEQSSQAGAPVTVALPAPVLASAEIAAPKAQDEIEAKVVAKAKATKPVTELQVTAIEALSEKTIVASAPEAASTHELEKDTNSTRAKEAAATANTAPSVPVAVAPAPILQAESANVEASADAASGKLVAKQAFIKKMKDAEQVQSTAKAELPSASAAAKVAIPTSNSAMAIALGKQGGQALANRDIQVGNLQILYLSRDTRNSLNSVDEATGYKKELVYVGDEASLKSLATELEAYNQTMRDWYLNQNR